jgi:hypothetical protein
LHNQQPFQTEEAFYQSMNEICYVVKGTERRTEEEEDGGEGNVVKCGVFAAVLCN